MKTLSILLLFCAAALGPLEAQTYTPRPVNGGGVSSVNSNTGTVTGAQSVAGADIAVNSVSSAGNIMSTGGSVGAQGSFISGNAYYNSASGYLQGASDGNWRFFNQAASLDGNVRMGNLNATGSVTNGATGTAVKNRRFVTATLAAGTVTVSDTAITATTQIYPSNYTTSGAVGIPYVASKTAGTGYTISDSNSSATNQVSVEIVDF